VKNISAGHILSTTGDSLTPPFYKAHHTYLQAEAKTLLEQLHPWDVEIWGLKVHSHLVLGTLPFESPNIMLVT